MNTFFVPDLSGQNQVFGGNARARAFALITHQPQARKHAHLDTSSTSLAKLALPYSVAFCEQACAEGGVWEKNSH